MAADNPRDVLANDRRQAIELVQRTGLARTGKVLERARRELEERLAHSLAAGKDGTFTAVQMRATLAQVRAVTKKVQGGIRSALVDGADEAAGHAVSNTLRYLRSAEKKFAGVAPPLALTEARILDAAASGAKASILRRLASSGEPVAEADAEPHPAKLNVIARYGLETIGHFEGILQKSFIARTPWAQVRNELTEASPFLQGAPAHWAERIVRTESFSTYNRAGWETVREADEELGDMVKILSATFDDRTGADSFAVHGQIRRPEEAFESWYGFYQHPPNRPNDREIVVPHRLSWPLPPYLAWKTDEQILARWRFEKRKGHPPKRPKMTTVPLERFGRQEKRPAKK